MAKHKYVNLEKFNKRLKSLGSTKYFKLAEGDNKIRILPRPDEEMFYVELTQHYGFKDGQRGRAYACLQAMKDKPCPICKFENAVRDEDEKLAKTVSAKTSFLMNIVDRSTGQVKIFSCGGPMLRGFGSYLTDEDYGEDLLDPETGHDFTITRTGTGFATKYSDPRISPKSKPVDVEDWEEKLHDLDKEVEILSYAELVKALEANYGDHIEELGLKFKQKREKEEDDNGDDEEAEEKPAPRKSAAKGKRRPVDEDSGDDEEEGDSEESGEDLLEDDETPNRRGKKTKPKPEAVEDDEEDLFDEDEEEEVIEEDEAPKKKKVRK